MLWAAIAAIALPVGPAAEPGATAAPAVAERPERAGRRPWYLPDHAKLQLAGNVGFVSPGLGWAFVGRHLETDVFFGWVPEAIGGDDILSVTGKVIGHPLALRGGPLEWRPVSLGVQVTYTFGERYFVRPPSRFPGKYYDVPTALRAGVGAGTAADVRIGDRVIGAYAELVALDVMLKAWADNPDSLGPADVFSLAIGVRAEL